jgi:hypothetical protein
MAVADATRLRNLEAENTRLSKLLVEGPPGYRSLNERCSGKALSTQAHQAAIDTMQAKTTISERRARQLVGLSRSVLQYQPTFPLKRPRPYRRGPSISPMRADGGLSAHQNDAAP